MYYCLLLQELCDKPSQQSISRKLTIGGIFIVEEELAIRPGEIVNNFYIRVEIFCVISGVTMVAILHVLAKVFFLP